MDPNDSDPFEGPFDIPEPDSGSAYEGSDSDAGQRSHDERSPAGVPRVQGKKDEEDILSEGESDSYSTPLANPNPDNQYTDEWISADALKWAASFVPPEMEDIPIPTRGAYGSRFKKRKLERLNGNAARAKRVKGFYSKDYRDLLNNEIYDAGAKSVLEDNVPLEGSQIGCSIWSPEEKDLFFTGLSRLGRDNVKAIAARIVTKSEVEVQEYMQILHQGLKEKKIDGARLLDMTEYPIAAEFTPECCEIMERAADGLALRQEQYEEDVEESKWGKYWLLTEELSKSLEKKRSASTVKDDEDVHDLLPAVRLLHLKNWLALSERVFMNPSEPNGEDNWRQIGEPGETPAIRATAFDDFHSLTVSITKRLVSTVLFCTMSRIRALDSNKTKAADINMNDVEAATKILKMDNNSKDFWIKCPRRNHLSISRHDEPSDSTMTYPEVEAELRKEYNGRRSRSRSCSRPHLDLDLPENISEVYTPSSDSILDSDIDISDDSNISDHFDDNIFTQRSASPSQSQSQSRSQRKHLSPEAYEDALEAHISALDARTSKLEEQRIWRLLGQDPPLDFQTDEEEELPEKPAKKMEIEGENNGEEWREREFWSEWEVMGRVDEEEFVRNRERIGRRERKEKLRESREGNEMVMRTRMPVRGEGNVSESGSEWDGVDESTLKGVVKGNARGSNDHHDGSEEPEGATKHRSYAVYHSDD